MPPLTSTSDETYTGDGYGMTATWDPALWQVKYTAMPGKDGIGLVNTGVDLNDASADSYFLQAEYQTSHLWTTPDEMKKNSMFEWFSEGMRGSTIIQQWETEDARSWFHITDVEGEPGKSLNYIEYSAVDAPNAVWRYLAISVDSEVFDITLAASLLSGITVDGESIPRAVEADTLLSLIDSSRV
ncbi:MAG TPA: hypothetical protein VNZ58_02305 [Thermomicrobiales bacterium]|nr:hypothetical protein [Thermomicrobiales bacterium]